MTRWLLPLFLLSVAMPSLAQAKRLEVAEIKSNSVLTDQERGLVYSADKMLDEQVASMWVEGEGSAGLGKYIEVKFAEEVTLAKIRIWPGCFVDEEFWGRHNRVRILEIKYPDFSSEKFEIKDKMAPQWLDLAEAKTLDRIKIYLRAVYEGNTWNDTAVTEMQFFDAAGPEGFIEGTKATASSEYPDPDKKNSYGPHLAVDGWTDTYWVEGGKSGDGEYLDIDLGARKTLKRFEIGVGYHETKSFFEGHNRAGRVTLSFSDGSEQAFSLDDKRGLQAFDLTSVTTSRVRVTFSEIRPGKSHDDLYVSEVRFWD
ncbi:MAG: hypothetical protein VX498_01280 [Myxococcota bacterium]|nr:hypothetical protein [Myxococcota bacterium]